MGRENTISLDVKMQFVEQLSKALRKRKISQSELARRMSTSRAVVYRMLQPDDISLTLKTMAVAASAPCFLIHLMAV